MSEANFSSAGVSETRRTRPQPSPIIATAFTLFTNDGGKPLAKTLALGKDGKLIKGVAAQMSGGQFRTCYARNIDDFADFLISGKYGPNCALSYGVNSAPDGYVSAQDTISGGRARQGAISRTAENFAFRDGQSAFMFFDIDPLPGQEDWDEDRYDEVLAATVPWWSKTRRFYVPSSSCEVYDARGLLVSTKRAYHLHIEVDNGAAIKSIGDAVFMALVDAGFGRVVISKSGARLLRTILDRAVWQGERLDFAFGAQLGAGLTQKRDALMRGDVPTLATAGKGRGDFDRWPKTSPVVLALMEAAQPQAELIERAWIEGRVEAAVKKGIAPEQARKAYARATSHGELPASMTLMAGDGSTATVGELLASPECYHHRPFRDPLEPDYAGGAATAIAYLIGQKTGPIIYSQAHGGRAYRLKGEDITAAEPGEAPAKGKKRAKLRVVEKGAAEGPVIQHVAGKLHISTTKAEMALIEAGASIYVRGHTLVRPVMAETAASDGRVTKTVALLDVDATWLRDEMTACIQWEKFDARVGDWVHIDAPKEVAETLLARKGQWSFQAVSGVINAPTLRPDGSILSAPGYDKATRLILLDDIKLPSMHEHPTKQDAEYHLAVISELLDEFPFVGCTPNDDSKSADKSVGLSTIITPVVRGCMATAPMHVHSASTAGTGKSYLGDVAAAVAMGHPCPAMSAACNVDELEKRIGAKLIAGHSIICLDNVNGELSGDLLCQIIDRPLVEPRILGSSRTVQVPNRHVVFSNGNNVRVKGDLTRRSITARLDAKWSGHRNDSSRTIRWLW